MAGNKRVSGPTGAQRSPKAQPVAAEQNPANAETDTGTKVFTVTELLEALSKVLAKARKLHIVVICVALAAVFGAGVTVGKYWDRWSSPGQMVDRATPYGILNYTPKRDFNKLGDVDTAIWQAVRKTGPASAVVWAETEVLADGKPTNAFTLSVASNLGSTVEAGIGLLKERSGAVKELMVKPPPAGEVAMRHFAVPPTEGGAAVILVVRISTAPNQTVDAGNAITVRAQ